MVERSILSILLKMRTVSSRFSGESIKMDHLLRDDLGIDSLALIEFAGRVSREFHCEISDFEIDNWVTVADVVQDCKGKMKDTER